MIADASLEAVTPHQQKLAAAAAWLPADLDKLFKERPTDALAFLAKNAEGRALVGSTKAYPLLHPLLFRLVDRPRLDVTPLVPLLRALSAFPGYDPGGTRQYEWVRLQAMRLLARHGDAAARAVIDRFIADFPERRDRTYAVSMIDVMAQAAFDLGAPELEPALRALLETMLLEYAPKQRAAELAVAEASLRKLARTRKKKGTKAEKK